MMEAYIKKSCYRMLSDRGYTLKDESKIYSIFKKKDDKPVIIIFSTDDKLNINNIKEYIQLKKDINHVVIVYTNSITSAAKKSINYYVNKQIELFNQKEILPFPLTDHVLVPKHEKVDKKEIERFVKDPSNLPKILTTDAIARYYYFKQNDIIKITRRTGIVAYRLVI